MVPDSSGRAPFEDSSNRVLGMLFRSLETALTRQFARRYDAGIALRPDRQSEDEAKMQVHLLCQGRVDVPVQIEVHHVGGNVYDVKCAVENGGSRQFVHCFRTHKDRNAFRCAPALKRKMTLFLLEELEKKYGRKLLRTLGSPPERKNADQGFRNRQKQTPGS